MTFRTRIFSSAFVALACAAGCSPTDRETQITLALSSETQIPDELDSFSIRVISTRTGELRFAQDYFPTSGREFPATLAVIPADEDSLGSPLRVEVEGRKGAQTAVRRSSVVSFLEGRNLLLNVPLRMACFAFPDCGPNATCAGGQCVDAEIQPTTLADFNSAYVFAEDGTCFNEVTCLSNPTELAVNQDCSFAIPAGVPQDAGNVSIRWAAAPARILALESNDAQEGWMRIDETHGRLSQGACDSHFQRTDSGGRLLVSDRAEKVYFSPACRSKTIRVPFCLSSQTGHSGIGAIVP